jgi:hypothetical protein
MICLSHHKIADHLLRPYPIRNPKSAIRNRLAVVYPIPHLYQQENPAHHSRTPAAAKGRMERRTRYVGTGFSLWQWQI